MICRLRTLLYQPADPRLPDRLVVQILTGDTILCSIPGEAVASLAAQFAAVLVQHPTRVGTVDLFTVETTTTHPGGAGQN